MELDLTLVQYMKKKAECAKLVSCALLVQCFVLAVFFCAYGLLQQYFMYKTELSVAKNIVIIISVCMTILLVVFNLLVLVKYRNSFMNAPDYIALRQSHDTVREAYIVARPILIYQITKSILVAVLSGLVYIILTIVMDRNVMSLVYGRVIVSIGAGLSIYIGLPALLRIHDYRKMLGELHQQMESLSSNTIFGVILSIVIPGSIELYYILRFYTDYCEIAFIVFPMIILFGFASWYLIDYFIMVRNQDDKMQ